MGPDHRPGINSFVYIFIYTCARRGSIVGIRRGSYSSIPELSFLRFFEDDIAFFFSIYNFYFSII